MLKYTDICTAAWKNLIVRPDGSCYTCCGAYECIGNIDINNINLNMVWNGPIICELRQNLLSGIVAKGCIECALYKTLLNTTSFQDSYKTIREQGFKNNISSYPTSIELYLTEACPLKCHFCSINREAGPNKMVNGKQMSIELIRELASKYFSNLTFLNTNCAGEFFLYKHFDEFISLLKRYKPNGVSTTTSGAVPLSNEKWEDVISTHSQISFSIDSFDQDYHESLRGFPLDSALKQFNIAKETRDRLNTSTQIGMSFIICKSSVREMFDFVVKSREKYDCDFVSLMHITGKENIQDSVLNDNYLKKYYNKQVKKILDYKENTGHNITDIGYCEDI